MEKRTCRECGESKESRKFKANGRRPNGELIRTNICTYCHNRRRDLRKKYGITIEQYEAMLSKQNGKCKVCDSPKSYISRKNKMDVDHCHKTGKVRGLLCNRCNKGIGYFGDDINLIKKALKYLETEGREVQ